MIEIVAGHGFHQLPEGRQWQYEVKFDGYRMEALKSGQSVRLLSRNGADYTVRFRAVAEAVAKRLADLVRGPGAGVLAPLTPLSVQPAAASGASGMRGAGLAGTTREPTLRRSATSGVRETWGEGP